MSTKAPQKKTRMASWAWTQALARSPMMMARMRITRIKTTRKATMTSLTFTLNKCSRTSPAIEEVELEERRISIT